MITNIEKRCKINSNTKAYLEIIIGCMYSGKSSKLIEIYKQCKF